MPSSPELALTTAFDAVDARLKADGTHAPMSFGWKEIDRTQKTGHRRIIWVPGDDAAGYAMIQKIKAPREAGHIVKHLYNVEELCTVYCEAADVSSLDNSRKQYVECTLLFNAWLRAMNLEFCESNFGLIRSNWVITRKNGAFGGAIRTVFFVLAVVPDVPLGSDPTTTELENLDSIDVTLDAEKPVAGEDPVVVYSEELTIVRSET